MMSGELWILEGLAVLFLAIPVIRPFFKVLQPLKGLNWLPYIALSLLIGIIPAYGFRPECLPLIVFAFFHSISCLVKQLSGTVYIDTGYGHKLLAGLALVILLFFSLPVIYFSPGEYGNTVDIADEFADGFDREAEPFYMQKISGATADYFLRVYGYDANVPADADKPLIFIIPPEKGSAASIDFVCTALREKGFIVVTYSRTGYDTPIIDENGKKHPASPAKLFSFRRVYKGAVEFASFNEKGRTLENERRRDIEFLLPRLPMLRENNFSGNRGGTAGGQRPVLLAGYGAGGTAVAYIAGEENFKSRNGNVLGAVAIESRLWSAYLPEPPKVIRLSRSENIFKRVWTGPVNWFNSLKRRRVERTGPLPGGVLPVMYLVSDRALDSHKGRRSYQAVFDTFESGKGPVVLAAVEGAGPSDFQDFQITHPVVSFLQPGLKKTESRRHDIDDTAAIIGNFGVYLLEQETQRRNVRVTEFFYDDNFYNDDIETIPEFPNPGREANIPSRHAINSGVYIQSRGLPGFRLHQ